MTCFAGVPAKQPAEEPAQREQGAHERALTTTCASDRPDVGERASGAATMEIDDRDVL